MLFTIGMVAVMLGIVGIIWGIFNKIRAGRVVDAPLVTTGDAAARGAAVASPKGAISVEGNVACAAPLVAPVSGVPCLWYSLKCTAHWEDTEGKKSKELDERKEGTRFTIDDGSGPVTVDAAKGGSFEPTKTSKQTKGAGLIGGLTGQAIQFGNYTVEPGLLGGVGRTYEVEEEYMPVPTFLFACGVVGPGNVITSPAWRTLMLLPDTREKLLGAAQKTAKLSLAGGAASFALGAALTVVAQIFFPADTAKGREAIDSKNRAAESAPARAETPATTPAKVTTPVPPKKK
jgi:hypothetical protein